MKSDYVNPFIQGTIDTFETMCGVRPRRSGKLGIKNGIYSTTNLVAICGFSGDLKGATALAMPKECGIQAVKAFTMGEIETIDEDFTDAFGELINIIAGAAAAKLKNVDLCLPTVHIGENLSLYSSANAPWVAVPMTVENWGEFFIEVSVTED